MPFQNSGKLKVLLVEDEIYMQILLNNKLKNNYDLLICSDVIEALAVLHEGNLPDLIISDFNLPGINGLQLIAQLKTNGFYSAIPIIMLSGEEDSLLRVKCLNSGADDFMVKPFNPEELVARINAIIRRTGV